MKSCLKKSYPFIILAILAFTLHLSFLSYPSQVVFDEVHFGKFVSAYFTGQYYFDIHPPLGKLMMAAFVKITNVNPVFDFDHIGEQAAPRMFFVLRFLPAFFGGLFVLAFAWLAYLISRSKTTALIAGFLILLDNAFLVQSRFILVDIFMLTFGILTFCFFFLYQRQKTYGAKWFAFLILTGISFGLTISIKWTGLATIGIIGAVLLAKVFSKKLSDYLTASNVIASPAPSAGRGNPVANSTNQDGTGLLHRLLAVCNDDWRRRFKEALIGLIFILIIGLAAYTIPFYIHFKLLPLSGPGDAFMSQAWQRELKYGRDNIYQPLSFFQKFLELNKTMFTANASIRTEHPYGSRWYSWPIDRKPIYYWTDGQPPSGKSANIYFVGNPVLWWLTLAFIALTLILIIGKKSRRGLKSIFYPTSKYYKQKSPNRQAEDPKNNISETEDGKFWYGASILLLAYFANLLPFILVKRVSFLYHYLPAASFGILLAALYLTQIYQKKKIFVVIFLLILAGFLFLAPYCYGLLIPNWLNKLEINLIGLLS